MMVRVSPKGSIAGEDPAVPAPGVSVALMA